MSKIIKTDLAERIEQLIAEAKKRTISAVNTAIVYTYYEIGKMIVEDEQQGEERAKYGKSILKDISLRLTNKFGRGFSVDNLENMRRFYLVYSNSETLSRNLGFTLSWSHYLKLIRIDNPEERRFYEIEARENNWSIRELQRQFDSSLYERLQLSRDKEGIRELSKKGQIIESPKDMIKDPYVLEFLGLEELPQYSESELEQRLIDNIQVFLLELGKGFTFVGRQVRFTFDEQHFRVDLVFYNRLLRAFVLIDLKRGTLKHQDLGQMQMYVNYYDRYIKEDFENPTIGILLCEEKNDALVELTLPSNANIYASAYQLYLPDKNLLQKKLKEWIEEFEENENL